MRKGYISQLRVAATLGVVLFHALGCYTNGWNFVYPTLPFYDCFALFINRINMPLFTAISGLLFGYAVYAGRVDNTFVFLTKKVFRLIVPYLLWCLLQFVIFRQTDPWEMSATGYLHLWYLLMLFVLFVVFSLSLPLWKGLSPGNSWVLLGLLFLLPVILRGSGIEVIQLLCFDRVLLMAPFFYGGLLLARADMTKVMNHRSLFTGLLVLLVITIAKGWSQNAFVLLFCQGSSLLIVLSLLTLGEQGTLFADQGVDGRWKPSLKRFIDSIDQCSMGIYIVHHIIIWWVIQQDSLHAFIYHHWIIAPFALFSFSLLASWQITRAILHFKPLHFILG